MEGVLLKLPRHSMVIVGVIQTLLEHHADDIGQLIKVGGIKTSKRIDPHSEYEHTICANNRRGI